MSETENSQDENAIRVHRYTKSSILYSRYCWSGQDLQNHRLLGPHGVISPIHTRTLQIQNQVVLQIMTV